MIVFNRIISKGSQAWAHLALVRRVIETPEKLPRRNVERKRNEGDLETMDRTFEFASGLACTTWSFAFSLHPLRFKAEFLRQRNGFHRKLAEGK